MRSMVAHRCVRYIRTFYFSTVGSLHGFSLNRILMTISQSPHFIHAILQDFFNLKTKFSNEISYSFSDYNMANLMNKDVSQL